mmetsp:Transcript_7100/g.20073  ORF Transcript_7100/g.20073 Transcript_7100/m.20073 type:complete len:304 (+) Transcript_7100:61-972(+)
MAGVFAAPPCMRAFTRCTARGGRPLGLQMATRATSSIFSTTTASTCRSTPSPTGTMTSTTPSAGVGADLRTATSRTSSTILSATASLGTTLTSVFWLIATATPSCDDLDEFSFDDDDFSDRRDDYLPSNRHGDDPGDDHVAHLFEGDDLGDDGDENRFVTRHAGGHGDDCGEYLSDGDVLWDECVAHLLLGGADRCDDRDGHSFDGHYSGSFGDDRDECPQVPTARRARRLRREALRQRAQGQRADDARAGQALRPLLSEAINGFNGCRLCVADRKVRQATCCLASSLRLRFIPPRPDARGCA